jgi:hypothetical protein
MQFMYETMHYMVFCCRYETISAFVTFETDESFELAMKWQRISAFRKTRGVGDRRGLGSRSFRGGPHSIELLEAPEPDSIFWENLEYGTADRFRRRLLVNCVLLALLVSSFALITLLSAFKEGGGGQLVKILATVVVRPHNQLTS